MKNFATKLLTAFCILNALFFLQPLKGQITFPYFCGFEDDENFMTHWTLKTANSPNPNGWYVGEAVKSRGEKGLYISPDGGATAGYENISCGIPAYFTLDLERNETYEFSFDWRMRAGGVDTLIVAVIDNPNLTLNSSSNEAVPSVIKMANTQFGFETSDSWQNFSFSYNAPANNTYRIVFYWINNSEDNYSPGACIDNFQISKKDGICEPPEDFKVIGTEGNKELVWTGSADSYELHYKIYNGTRWTEVTGLTTNSYSVDHLPKGIYSFWLRSKCGNDSSAWAIIHNVLVMTQNLGCLDFTDLHSDNVRATTGMRDDPYIKVGIVDFGFASKFSRHTVHYLSEEYDYNTGYALKTVPEDELASVRLGNWDNGGESESITYYYPVEEGREILLMKYALVLEDPNHGEKDQPQFVLEIRDMSGKLLDEECGRVYFYASDSLKGWNTYEKNGTIRWKDWTTFGIDLQDYMGETVQVTLITYDCKMSQHFGYAYFTLDCAERSISGLTCGDNTVESIIAPDGFRYEWRRKGDPTVISEEREYEITDPNDVATYICTVISLENDNCSFDLEASLKPQFPKALFSYEIKREECENRVYFTNKSYVETEDGEVMDRDVETIEWDFDNGEGIITDKDYMFVYEPGTYDITLTVGLADKLCTDVWKETIEILPIGHTADYDTVPICEGNYHTVFGNRVSRAGDHEFTKKNSDGCTDTVYLHLIVHEKVTSLTKDTICYGGVYEFGELECTETDTYTQILTSLVTGCDSIATLELLVRPEIIFSLSSTPVMDGNDGSIIIDADHIGYDYTYEINGEENGSLTGLSFGDYTITLFVDYDGLICESDPQTITLVRECLSIEADNLQIIFCADDTEVEIPYTISQGGMDKYSISFSNEALAAGFTALEVEATSLNTFVFPIPEKVTPGHYAAIIDFPGQVCDVSALEVPFSIYYSSDIIAQRWNDVLAVRSQIYNGGFNFYSYQWYKDNIAIPGANKSYLFEESELDMNAVYTVELIRLGETESVMTCGIIPERLDVDFQLQDNTAKAGGSYRMNSSQSGTARIYSLTGVVISEQSYSTGLSQIKAPDAHGYYILQMKFEDNSEKTFHINVSN